MMFVRRSTYRALQAEHAQALLDLADVQGRSKAERARADRLEAILPEASAEEIKAWEHRVEQHEQWTRPTDQEARPVDGGTWRPQHPATDLRRAQEQCLALEALLARAEGRRTGATS